MAENKPRRLNTYTKNEKLRAVSLVQQNGELKPVAEKLGIPRGTLRDWMKDKELTENPIVVEATEAFNEVMLEQSADLAQRAGARILGLIKHEDDLRKLTALWKEANQIHNLKSGQPTSRTETTEPTSPEQAQAHFTVMFSQVDSAANAANNPQDADVVEGTAIEIEE